MGRIKTYAIVKHTSLSRANYKLKTEIKVLKRKQNENYFI